jgi:hypothetical protein
MREIRPSGSEGGAANAVPTPIQGAQPAFHTKENLRLLKGDALSARIYLERAGEPPAFPGGGRAARARAPVSVRK